MRKVLALSSVVLFLVAKLSVAPTLYMCFGDWPQAMMEVVDYGRSLAATA